MCQRTRRYFLLGHRNLGVGMKRVGVAVGFAFLVLLTAQCFTNSAYADTPKFPPLTIQEDDAVPEIAKYKELYERVTASEQESECFCQRR